MGRFFTQRQRRPEISEAPGRRLSLRTRLHATSLLVLGSAIALVGCTKPYGAVLRQYNDAPACCASLAELTVEPLKLGDEKSFDLGGGSPAYRFETGKSYFRAFALPQGPYPYRVTVRSYFIGDDLKSAYLFYPQLITLDENRRMVRSTGAETFTVQPAGFFETMHETGGLPYKVEGGLTFSDGSRDERYLVVLTTDDLLRGQTSTAGEVPIFTPGYTVTVPEGNAVNIPHAPAGRVNVSLSLQPKQTIAARVAGNPAGGATVFAPPDHNPEVVTVRLASGKIVGTLELGRSTIDSARSLFESAGAGLGAERQNAATFVIGAHTLTPKRLFTPPGSHHQLYFDDQGILVLFLDGTPTDLPLSGEEFLRRFPEARESGRTSFSYEIQTPLTPCVTLMAVFRAAGDTLESAAYGYGCRVK